MGELDCIQFKFRPNVEIYQFDETTNHIMQAGQLSFVDQAHNALTCYHLILLLEFYHYQHVDIFFVVILV